MKKDSILPKFPELVSHHQMQFSAIPMTHLSKEKKFPHILYFPDLALSDFPSIPDFTVFKTQEKINTTFSIFFYVESL